MRIRRVVAAAAGVAAVAAVPVAGQAAEGKTDKVTGGGQVLMGSSGKYSTITFTAQNTTAGESAGKGQVQFIDRSAGAGRNQVKYHGVVTCVIVEGNRAQIAGYRKKAADPSAPESQFELTVVDNGEPNENDMVLFDNSDIDGQCSTDDSDQDEEPELTLAKGNAQVRDGDPNNSFPEEQGAPAGLPALGLGL